MKVWTVKERVGQCVDAGTTRGVWNQVCDELRFQVLARVWTQVSGQVCEQMKPVSDQVRYQIDSQVKDQFPDFISAMPGWLQIYSDVHRHLGAGVVSDEGPDK